MHGFDLVLRMVPLMKCPGLAAGGLEAVPPPDEKLQDVAPAKATARDAFSLPFGTALASREAAR